jgi:hypothetical protein
MTLFGGNPSGVTPGWGGYTYPLKTPVIVQIATRVNPLLCTLSEAYRFLDLVAEQGDIIPPGQLPMIYEETSDQLLIDPAYLAGGYLPLILTWRGQPPSKGARDVPEPGNPETPDPSNPYTYAVNVGMMYASAPRVPGAQGAYGPQAFRTDFKLQVSLDGSLLWVGLDVKTWMKDIPTAAAAS